MPAVWTRVWQVKWKGSRVPGFQGSKVVLGVGVMYMHRDNTRDELFLHTLSVACLYHLTQLGGNISTIHRSTGARVDLLIQLVFYAKLLYIEVLGVTASAFPATLKPCLLSEFLSI